MRLSVVVLGRMLFAGHPGDPQVLTAQFYDDIFEMMEYIIGRIYYTFAPGDDKPREDAGNRALIETALDLDRILVATERVNRSKTRRKSKSMRRLGY